MEKGYPSYSELLKDEQIFQQHLKEMIKLSKELEEDCEHKDRYSNPYSRELERMSGIHSFLPFTNKVTVEDYSQGLVIVNKRYIVSLRNNVWRVKGKNKWYCYKDIEQLITKYVLKE